MPQYALQVYEEASSYDPCTEEALAIYSLIIVCSIDSTIFLHIHKAHMNHNSNFIIHKVQQITVLIIALHKLVINMPIYGLRNSIL